MPLPEYVRRMRAHIGSDLLMLVGAAAIIHNDTGHILLQRRSDTGRWGLPGGTLEPGEEPAYAVIREVREETGLTVTPERIVGVYGGPNHLVTFPNGDQCAYTSITFACRILSGALRTDDDESLELRWFPPDALPEPMVPHHVERIQHATTRETPFFRL